MRAGVNRLMHAVLFHIGHRTSLPFSANPQLPLKAIKKHALKMPGIAIKCVSSCLHVFVHKRQSRMQLMCFVLLQSRLVPCILPLSDSLKCERCKKGLCKVRSAPPGRISHTSSVTAHTRHYKAGEKLGRSLDFLLRLLCVAFLFSTFMFFFVILVERDNPEKPWGKGVVTHK